MAPYEYERQDISVAGHVLPAEQDFEPNVSVHRYFRFDEVWIQRCYRLVLLHDLADTSMFLNNMMGVTLNGVCEAVG